MKRALSLVLVTGILAVWAPQPGRAEGRRIGFFVNLGFMTKERVSPNWLTLGAEIAIPLGSRWSLNPEVTQWGSSFNFNNYYVVPGVVVNFRFGRVSLGAGVVKRLWISRYSDDDSSEKIAPKIQVGYQFMNSRIALIVIPIPDRDYVSFGLAFGTGF
jgi:hypothetical protein